MTRYRNRAIVSVAACPLVFLLASATCQAQKYSVNRLLMLPGGTNVSASGINNAGAVVGDSDDANGNTHAVEWSDSTPIPLHFDGPPFLGWSSGAVAINNQGVIIGDAHDTESSVWETGPGVGAGQSFDLGISVNTISDTNVIVGYLAGHPAIWSGVDLSQRPNAGLSSAPNSDGAYEEGTGINVSGVIVGTQNNYLPDSNDTYPIAVRWKPDPATGELGEVAQVLIGLGGRDSAAASINAKGFIAGWATLPNNRMHAAIWGPATRAVDLGTLGGKQSSAGAINAEGDIAGDAQDINGNWHATLWTHKHYKPIDLNLEIDAELAKQVTLISASATNDRCDVLVNGIDKKTGAGAAFVLSLIDQSDCNQP
jgi:probable HAF family extracellular repeat protein